MFRKGFLAAVVLLAAVSSSSLAEVSGAPSSGLTGANLVYTVGDDAAGASSGGATCQQASSSHQAVPVPEPATLALLGIGALIMLHRRPERFIGQDAEGERETAAAAVVVCTWQDRPQAEQKDMSSLMAK